MMQFKHIERFFVRLSAIIAIIGGIGLIFATIVTCLSIILRLAGRSYNTLFATALPEKLSWLGPILGEEELVTYGVGLAIFSALPWATIQRKHIRVDLFKSKFSVSANKLLNLLGDIAMAAIAYFILTRQWFLVFKPARKSEENTFSLLMQSDFDSIIERIRISHESQILGFPLWPTYLVAEFCIIILFFTSCFCVLRSILEFKRAKQSNA